MDDHDPRTELAVFRNGLIIGAIHRDLPRGAQTEILRQVAAQEWLLPDGRRRRFSVRTLQRYLAARRSEAGLWALLPQPRKDAGARKVLPDAAWDLAQQLKREEPRRSTRTILAILQGRGLLDPDQVSEATLRRHLRQAGLTRKLLLGANQKVYRRWQRSEPGALWQIDATGGLWLPDPRTDEAEQLWCLQAEDDASRLITAARLYPHAHQAALDDLLLRAIRRWGVPAAVFVDRGSIFVSAHFRRVCAELGIEWIPGTPYYPEARGKLENRNRLLKQEFFPEAELEITAGRITSVEALNHALDAWVDYVNHRVHRETKQKPADVYGSAPRNPYPDPIGLARLFLWRKTVRVDKFGTASLEGNRFDVGADLARRSVQLRYDPFDLRQAELWVDGAQRGLVRPVAVVERVAKAVQAEPPRPNTGLTLLGLLVEQFDQSLRQLAGDIAFRDLPVEAGPRLADLVGRIEPLLGRALRPEEQHALARAWQERGPLAAQVAADRLRPHLARIGRATAIADLLDILWKE
jgi:putative transposase